MFPILVSCVPSPAPSATSVDSGVTTSTSTTPTTTSPVPMACAAVSGTRSVWLVDRADPTQHAEPTLRPSDHEVARDLAGPDAAGWLYLLAGPVLGPTLLYRSSDAGCTWSLAWDSPADEDGHLYLHRDGTRLYIRDDARLYVSDDGGVSFAFVTDQAPQTPLGVVPRDPDHLWAYDDVGILESPDGGVTWEARQAFPGPYDGGGPRFDVSVDPPRVATSHGDEVLWVWDGGWTERAKGHEDFGVRAWDNKDGTLSVFARTARGQPLTVLQAAGGAPPFDEVWAPAEDEGGPFLVSEGGDIATAGFADFTTWVVVRKEDGTVVRHATDGFSLVAGLLMLDDVVVVAFGTEGPWFP